VNTLVEKAYFNLSEHSEKNQPIERDEASVMKPASHSRRKRISSSGREKSGGHIFYSGYGSSFPIFVRDWQFLS